MRTTCSFLPGLHGAGLEGWLLATAEIIREDRLLRNYCQTASADSMQEVLHIYTHKWKDSSLQPLIISKQGNLQYTSFKIFIN